MKEVIICQSCKGWGKKKDKPCTKCLGMGRLVVEPRPMSFNEVATRKQKENSI